MPPFSGPLTFSSPQKVPSEVIADRRRHSKADYFLAFVVVLDYQCKGQVVSAGITELLCVTFQWKSFFLVFNSRLKVIVIGPTFDPMTLETYMQLYRHF